jgi:hypothetical protein
VTLTRGMMVVPLSLTVTSRSVGLMLLCGCRGWAWWPTAAGADAALSVSAVTAATVAASPARVTGLQGELSGSASLLLLI